jgi:hypothetical protein
MSAANDDTKRGFDACRCSAVTGLSSLSYPRHLTFEIGAKAFLCPCARDKKIQQSVAGHGDLVA